MKIPVDTTFENKDPYRILGVPVEADPAAIRKAYLDLVRKNHPDLFATDPTRYLASTALMQDIGGAYELLSDPARRELWDRQHPAERKPAPRPAAKRKVHPESPHVNLVIRKYNEFVRSLRTPAEQRAAVRKVRAFQASRAGYAFIRKLIDRHYLEVIDRLSLCARITEFDDGLVEITFLYPGALEVAPGNVYVTYAYLVHRQNKGRLPPEPVARRRAQVPPRPADYRLRVPQPPREPAPPRRAPKSVSARVWDWLMAKPGSPRR
ncbi:MAG: J domain-containing protein [bacterium]